VEAKIDASEAAGRLGRQCALGRLPSRRFKGLFAALSEQHDVVAADSGRQALDLLGHGEVFDLILSNMMMPDMTGMQFYEALLQTLPDLANRVIFVSGGGMTPQTRDFLATISNTRVEMPFSVSKLRSTVNEVLARLPVSRARQP